MVDPRTNNYNFAANQLCASVGSANQPSFGFACTLEGRYVSIQLLPNLGVRPWFLTLCEVQVGASNSGAGSIESGAAPSTPEQKSALRCPFGVQSSRPLGPSVWLRPCQAEHCFCLLAHYCRCSSFHFDRAVLLVSPSCRWASRGG